MTLASAQSTAADVLTTVTREFALYRAVCMLEPHTPNDAEPAGLRGSDQPVPLSLSSRSAAGAVEYCLRSSNPVERVRVCRSMSLCTDLQDATGE